MLYGTEKFYGIFDCADPTVLIVYDTKDDLQRWLRYERDIDKQLNLIPETVPFSRRISTNDSNIISKFIDNPKAEKIKDELDKSACLYIIHP